MEAPHIEAALVEHGDGEDANDKEEEEEQGEEECWEDSEEDDDDDDAGDDAVKLHDPFYGMAMDFEEPQGPSDDSFSQYEFGSGTERSSSSSSSCDDFNRSP
ncbi:acidic leucine-rich nuclear phosphoprotein 32 family member B-like [Chenopodium quinoa]|uniref:acidic leucine-rich nuclear phosphoprotein 32 family member B-like n=1 Tax=Chenopodium quinoa TaxID=63459 RepID=UPI000B7956B5|nr:acidic leucine-rich nuclear phosphoprotein 32 family member B-like [Chenopodium quinoa]